MLKTFKILFILITAHLFIAMSHGEVHVAVMLNSEKEAEAYNNIVAVFHAKKPNAKITLHYFSDIRYKKDIKQWIRDKKFDLLYWQAGRTRLFNLAQEGLLEDLSNLWHAEGIGESLSANLKPLVDFKGKIIAIPYSYYHWGMFYNRELFSRLNISPPKSYHELLKSCRVLWKNGVLPIGMGLSEQWPVLAWYSYFAIRMYGMEYYRKIVDGEISWLDERNYLIMKNWGRLLSACTTNSDARQVNWRTPARSLVREETGMVLSGNFVMQLFNTAEQQTIGYFPFPQIDETLPNIESAPVEVWIMPKGGNNGKQARQFVQFFMQPENINNFNLAISYLSPHLTGNPTLTGISKQGVEMLRKADGLVQYIDRDAKPDIVNILEQELTNYINHRDIDMVLLRLEAARNKHYRQKAPADNEALNH